MAFREPSSKGAWFILVMIGVTFFLIEHDLFTSRNEMFGTTADQLETRAGTSHLISQAGIASLSALGAWCLLFGDRRRWSISWSIVVPIILYLAWCTASIAWSTEKGLTGKRVVALYLLFFGTLGLARRLPIRFFCLTALLVPVAFALIGIGAELALGTFRPWKSDYRFAGTVHPNTQGYNCIYICVSGMVLMATSKRRVLLAACIALGLICLILTKSRTSLFTLVATVTIIWLVRASIYSMFSGAVLAIGAAAAVIFAAQFLPEGNSGLKETVLMGREEHAGTFSGRTELWKELSPFAQRRLLIGYGYRSFWTPQRISEVSDDLFWGMSSAHSMYLDNVLSIGVIGTGFLLWFGLGAMIVAAREYRRTGNPIYGLALGLFLCGAISGLLESAFVAPSMEAGLAGVALGFIAFFREHPAAETATNALAAAPV